MAPRGSGWEAHTSRVADLNISLHPQQGRAFLTDAQEILYGGAAGGGKSHLIRASLLAFCGSVPGFQGFLFRRNYADLLANHMNGPGSFPELLAAAVRRGHCEILSKEIRFSNGSQIALRHVNLRKDLAKYQGLEIHAAGFDELTHFTEEMYRYIRGRCRLGGLRLPAGLHWKFPRLLSGSNPGGVGHHWVKKTFVDNGPYKVHRASKAEGGMERVFIPARLEDNPTLLTNDPDYIDRLEGLGDPMLVRAMKTGDWNVVAGSYFGDVWREELHTCRPFAIPKGWPIWRGMDDGFAAPAAIYWFTQDPDLKTVYVIAEVYREKLHPDAIAEIVKRVDAGIQILDEYGDVEQNAERITGIIDSAAFAETGQQSSGGQKVDSRGKQMNAHGLNWRPCAKPTNGRIQAAQNFHRLLGPNPRDPAKRPGIIFFKTCREAIRTIPTLARDPDNIEDVNTEGEDHAYDAIRYGLQFRAGTSGQVKTVGT